jgi:hypothetical protein
VTALSDLRAAVARADEVLGCGATECFFRKGERVALCECVNATQCSAPAHALAALYKVAKAVVEEQSVPVRGLDLATLEPYLNREVEVMGVRGTIAEHKATASGATQVTNAGFAGAAQAEFLAASGLRCHCWSCLREIGLMPRVMVVCHQCGNKRCPRATSHDNACSGSNEPGQDGSE